MKPIQDIKRLSIRDYLSERGFYPAKDTVRYGFYLSPFRSERTPSFKVDYALNLWYDHGTGEGGSIIDLVMRLENCDFTQAVQSLGSDEIKPTASVVPPPIALTAPALRIRSDTPLQHPALLGYLKERGIDTAIATEHCREVRYAVGDKTYFAIGFRNNAEGWELRSERFKGSSTPKDITTIDNSGDTIMAFKEFMDILSYLTLKGNAHPTCDTAVLNSVVNLPKAIPFLERHSTIHAFFDNDNAGRDATAKLKRLCPNSIVIDQSYFYREHKDLNEYWQAEQRRLHIAPIRKRGVKM